MVILKSMIKYLCLLIVLCLMSCESDSDRNRDLISQIESKKQSVAFLEKESAALLQELSESWMRSLKYRFPNVQPIVQHEVPLEIKTLPYLRAIRVQYKSNHTLNISFTYKTNEKDVIPQFTLFLFNGDGANIHRENIIYKGLVFSKELKPGKQYIHAHTIQIMSQGVPQYFLIKEINK